jgi:hypothetical protein
VTGYGRRFQPAIAEENRWFQPASHWSHSGWLRLGSGLLNHGVKAVFQ